MWHFIILSVLFFIGWIFLLWEVIKNVGKSKDKVWIILCSIGSTYFAFFCGLFLCKLLF